ncbi:MAG: hypothetical protein HUU15_05935 [Candidatus Brocadiae bacterium]|nr:hypothetical protein [Candidatus Brocadiia bacterium]
MKPRLRWALAALVVAACGCSSGYPSTQDRIENVETTIRKNSLTGEPEEARDKRFTDSTKTGGTN